jgi:hypothetical protein
LPWSRVFRQRAAHHAAYEEVYRKTSSPLPDLEVTVARSTDPVVTYTNVACREFLAAKG